MNKTLYLIDGHWQIFRAYYAPLSANFMSPRREPTKATYIFNSMLLKLIAERQPDYLAVIMDSGRELLHRTAIYPQYKAQRSSLPEDLPVQINRIIQVVKAMGLPLLAKPGAEADDIIATLACRLAGPQLDVVLVSRDKDLDQLLGPHVSLYDPMKDEQIDAQRLFELKGYRPDQAVEVYSLCGDSTDNVPGVPGVGCKTAAKLINQYGSAEAVIAAADKLTPKLSENIRAHVADVKLARELVKLAGDVEIDVSLEDLTFSGIRKDLLTPLYEELGFKRLIEQLDRVPGKLGSGVAPAGEVAPTQAAVEGQPRQSGPTMEGGLFPPPAVEEKKTAGETPLRDGTPATPPMPTQASPTRATGFDYRLVNTPEALDAMVEELRGAPRLAVDTETDGIQPVSANLVGISLCRQAGRAFYVPVAAPLCQAVLDLKLVRAKLAPLLADPAIEKIGHHIKFDIIVLGNAGIKLAGPMFDTMLAAYCLQADRGSFRLDSIAMEKLNHQGIPIEELLGKGKNQRTMAQVPVEQVAIYASEDADVAFRLADKLRDELAAEQLTDLFQRIEMSLMPVLVEMERTGIKIDQAELNRQRVELSARAERLREEIITAAGCQFNPDSPRQLADVLFVKLNLAGVKRTKTGLSTDSDVLENLAQYHPVPGMVLEYRQLTKLLGTYLVALGECVDARTGRVHTSFHQAGTATGRLSSSNPNLQNIPIRTELGRRIRGAFVADDGKTYISADYSQIELRVLAHLSQDPTLVAAFHADQDIHRIVAAEVFGVPPDQVTPEQRARAKTVNFGIIYGQTAFGLAATLKIPRGEAAAFIAGYRKRFPRIEAFLQECIAQARAKGYVQTLAGRRRRIEGFDSANPQRKALAERLAINSVVQGSAADLIKIAMINVHRRFERENRPARMLLQIHDELLIETPIDQAQHDAEILKQEMNSAMQLRVPLKVDIGIGPNWRDAKP